MDGAKKKNLMLLGGAGLVFIFLVFFLLGDSFGSSGGNADDGTVFTAIPEAERQDLNESKSDIYRSKTRIERDNEKYFSGLDRTELDTTEISLVTGSGKKENILDSGMNANDVMASLFQEQVEPEPMQAKPQPVKNSGSGGSGRRSSSAEPKAKSVSEMTADERMDFDRRRAEMMRDVLMGETPVEEKPLEEEQRISEFRNSPVQSSVISSLDDDAFGDDSSWTAGQSSNEDLPVRCIFVRTEKLKSGQRVTVRLLEDYEIEGMVIPANSHLSATCTIGDRLTLKVSNAELGGRIIPLNLDAYDRDGSLGIYCPETGNTRNQKTVTNNALTTATSTIGGMVGRLAGAAINTGASVVRSTTGDVTVTISSGYEFYLMKSKRR